MFSSDPKIVSDALLIKEISYRQAQELATLGAKVLHPRCIGPVYMYNIPLELRNTFDPDTDNKTVISNFDNNNIKSKIIGVVSRKKCIIINILSKFVDHSTPGYLKGVFSTVHSFGISVDLVATSTFSVTIVIEHIPGGGVEGTLFKRMLPLLENHGQVSYIYPVSIVSIVGYKLRSCLPRIGKALSVYLYFTIYIYYNIIDIDFSIL